MIGITGYNSRIIKELLKLPEFDKNQIIHHAGIGSINSNCDSYILCSGRLFGQKIGDMTESEKWYSWSVNFTDVAVFCDHLFEVNKYARVVVIGSESGFKGSYDMAYAGAKAALHLYVESKRLEHPGQHLVCVAPTIIEDARMTLIRRDLDATLKRGKERRLGRWLQSKEVARIAYFALNQSALCNTVIKATGGNW